MVSVCEECGSSSVISTENGYVCCQECGLVQEEKVFDISASKYLKNQSSGQVEFQTKIGITGTQIGSSTERNSKFHRLHKLQSRYSKTPDQEAFATISQICSNLDINIPVNQLMMLFQKGFRKMPEKSKARNITLFCSTLVYRVAKSKLINISLKNFLELNNIDLSDYFFMLNELNKINLVESVYSPTNNLNIAKSLVNRLNEELNLGEQRITVCSKLLEKYIRYFGQTPQIIAGTVVSLVLEHLPLEKPIKVYKIAKFLQTSASTIYLRLKKLPEQFISNFETYCEELTQPKLVAIPIKQTLKPSIPNYGISLKTLIRIEAQLQQNHLYNHLNSEYSKKISVERLLNQPKFQNFLEFWKYPKTYGSTRELGYIRDYDKILRIINTKLSPYGYFPP